MGIRAGRLNPSYKSKSQLRKSETGWFGIFSVLLLPLGVFRAFNFLSLDGMKVKGVDYFNTPHPHLLPQGEKELGREDESGNFQNNYLPVFHSELPNL